MEVARFDPGGSELVKERRAPDPGLFASFKYKLTMLLTQVKWQQVSAGAFPAMALERGRL